MLSIVERHKIDYMEDRISELIVKSPYDAIQSIASLYSTEIISWSRKIPKYLCQVDKRQSKYLNAESEYQKQAESNILDICPYFYQGVMLWKQDIQMFRKLYIVEDICKVLIQHYGGKDNGIASTFNGYSIIDSEKCIVDFNNSITKFLNEGYIIVE